MVHTAQSKKQEPVLLAAVFFRVAVLPPWHLIILRQKPSTAQQRKNVKMLMTFLLPTAMSRCPVQSKQLVPWPRALTKAGFLWIYDSTLPWCQKLEELDFVNIVNPNEDFISNWLWNGLMNSEAVIHIEKKTFCT